MVDSNSIHILNHELVGFLLSVMCVSSYRLHTWEELRPEESALSFDHLDSQCFFEVLARSYLLIGPSCAEMIQTKDAEGGIASLSSPLLTSWALNPFSRVSDSFACGRSPTSKDTLGKSEVQYVKRGR